MHMCHSMCNIVMKGYPGILINVLFVYIFLCNVHDLRVTKDFISSSFAQLVCNAIISCELHSYSVR